MITFVPSSAQLKQHPHGPDNPTSERSTSARRSDLVFPEARAAGLDGLQWLSNVWQDEFRTCNYCRQSATRDAGQLVRLLRLPEGNHRDVCEVGTVDCHLQCAAANGLVYYAVSHAWDSSVGDAWASRVPTLEAAEVILTRPLRVLQAVTRRFGPQACIWHDYISIPQWNDKYRGTKILPQIFEIFHHACAMVVYLDHLSCPVVLPSSLREASTLSVNVLDGRWFTRLWPVVEYDACRSAFIMDRDYKIADWTLASLLLETRTMHAMTSRDSSLSMMRRWTNACMFMKAGSRPKCLGQVYDIIAGKGCRSHHDYFIATCALLGLSHRISSLPESSVDACLQIAHWQIAIGDVSALLLRPNAERGTRAARWLRGHTKLDRQIFGWGQQIAEIDELPEVVDCRIQLSVQSLGLVQSHLSWDGHPTTDGTDVKVVVEHLINSTRLSVKGVLQTLGNIFPTVEGRYVNDGSFSTLEPKYQSKLCFPSRSTQVLSRSTSFGEERSASTSEEELYRLIAGFSSSYGHPEGLPFDRLESQFDSFDVDEHRLVVIKCELCQTLRAMRVSLWAEPSAAAEVFLLPGLSYEASIGGSVGVLMEDGHVIGRSRFIRDYCSCSVKTKIEI